MLSYALLLLQRILLHIPICYTFQHCLLCEFRDEYGIDAFVKVQKGKQFQQVNKIEDRLSLITTELLHFVRAAQTYERTLSYSDTAGWPGLDRPGCFQVSDRKSTRLNSSHVAISYAVFC